MAACTGQLALGRNGHESAINAPCVSAQRKERMNGPPEIIIFCAAAQSVDQPPKANLTRPLENGRRLENTICRPRGLRGSVRRASSSSIPTQLFASPSIGNTAERGHRIVVLLSLF